MQHGKGPGSAGLDPVVDGLTIGIVVSRFNAQVTDGLLEGALGTLKECGIEQDRIRVVPVPGSFELPLGADIMIREMSPDAVICLGSLIRGETDHYDYLAAEVSRGIGVVALRYHLPVVFGVLTTHNLEQALDRAGGRHGNKGEEAALTALHMVALQQQFSD